MNMDFGRHRVSRGAERLGAWEADGGPRSEENISQNYRSPHHTFRIHFDPVQVRKENNFKNY